MEEAESERNPVSIYFLRFTGQSLTSKLVEDVFGSERQPFVRRPKHVDATRVLFGSLVDDVVLRPDRRKIEVTPGVFQPSEQLLGDFLVDGSAVAPRVGAVEIIVELIEARDLSRFERGVGDQRSLQDSERGRTHGGVG